MKPVASWGQGRRALTGRGKAVFLAVGLALLIGLIIWGGPWRMALVISQPNAMVKVIPSYALNIQPFLGAACAQCHQGSQSPGGMDLASYDGLTGSSPRRPLVVPGRPEQSYLLAHLKGEVEPELWRQCRLPGKEPTPNQIDNLEKWIRQGARNN